MMLRGVILAGDRVPSAPAMHLFEGFRDGVGKIGGLEADSGH